MIHVARSTAWLRRTLGIALLAAPLATSSSCGSDAQSGPAPGLEKRSQDVSSGVSDPALAPADTSAASADAIAASDFSQFTLQQTALDGATLPKYVEPLPTFAGQRVNGRQAVSVNMLEFQQKILPASFYSKPGPV